ncbi:MAG: hypothetical protein KDC37_06065, partial [Flavobacteriales bacterium]|nr:hypothetical protein [Flavobacteriales bacterium]
MSLIRFQYNSHHKILTAAALIAISVWQFWGRNTGEEYYPNGQIKQEGGMLHNKNHGVWTWYYPSGAVRMKGKFENGKRVGKWVFNDKKGRTSAEGTYHND